MTLCCDAPPQTWESHNEYLDQLTPDEYREWLGHQHIPHRPVQEVGYAGLYPVQLTNRDFLCEVEGMF